VQLQQCIDNLGGNLHISLRTLTYIVGWYNVEADQTISWRPAVEGSPVNIYSFAPGLYTFAHFRNIVRRLRNNISLSLDNTSGLIKLQIPPEWVVKFTDGLLNLMGLDDGLNGQWLETGVYNGDRPADFSGLQALHVHLDQISTTENWLNGAPSRLLCLVPIVSGRTNIITPLRFGDINAVRFHHPELKRLTAGMINELKFTVRDDRGRVLDNHGLNISVVVEIQ